MKISIKTDSNFYNEITKKLLNICSPLFKEFTMYDNTPSILLNLSSSELPGSYNKKPSDLSIRYIFSETSKRNQYFKYLLKPPHFPCKCYFFDGTSKVITSNIEYTWYARDIEWCAEILKPYRRLLIFKGHYSSIEILNSTVFYQNDLSYLKFQRVPVNDIDREISLEIFNTLSSPNINLIEVILDVNNIVIDIKIPKDFIFDDLVLIYKSIFSDFLSFSPTNLDAFSLACINETNVTFYLH